ncbi:ABC-F family ATP-binding cassette domain-containing protein [Rhodococcoides corynebacterioides]|uniref:ABC-F family ATP-binding cassette domain-containing protein n=1 Tax=Rhodococcoides corynebacterioides TaxID=53972 RepID=UPI003AE2E493
MSRSLSSDSSSVVVTDLTYSFPDGRTVVDGLSATFPVGTTGLVGTNGSGKSTLLQLIAGLRTPSSGSVTVRGTLGYVPQRPDAGTSPTVADRLGIGDVRAALARIERGSTRPSDFDVVGADWDVEERSLATLSSVGLDLNASGTTYLDRPVATLSGGEATQLAVAAQMLRRPDVLLLDEPTNNLDGRAREALRRAIAARGGTVIVVSHDVALLETMDRIAEMRSVREQPASITLFGGNFSHYRATVEAEQEAALAATRSAVQDVRRQHRDLQDARTTIDRRRKMGDKADREKRVPRIVAHNRRSAAQESAARYRLGHEKRLSESRERLDDARDAIRDDAEIVVDLPGTEVHSDRTVVDTGDIEIDCGGRFPGRTVRLTVSGPERVAVTGDNGAGKTTLLRALRPDVPSAYLTQSRDDLDDGLSVVENVTAVAPTATVTEIRTRLARFLFRGRRAEAAVRTLSGGERVRAALATVLLTEPPPQLLILDEPTNDLDLASREQLVSALCSFRGALIVVSHDVDFLERLGVTRRLHLSTEGLAPT